MRMTVSDIEKLNYVDFMALLRETNRPPGGKEALRIIAQNVFLGPQSSVLHVGCNTGSSTREFVHLAKCTATGIDLSEKMVAEANRFKEVDAYRGNLDFRVGDARKLEFSDSAFDLVFSAGSTAFMNERDAAIREMIRVTKDWGFIADTVLYYREKPPVGIVESINGMLGLEIKPWGLDYWEEIYGALGLERFFVSTGKMYYASKAEVAEYCRYMANKEHVYELTGGNSETMRYVEERLYGYMDIFNENHNFLNYGILVYRKRPEPEEKTLFGV